MIKQQQPPNQLSSNEKRWLPDFNTGGEETYWKRQSHTRCELVEPCQRRLFLKPAGRKATSNPHSLVNGHRNVFAGSGPAQRRSKFLRLCKHVANKLRRDIFRRAYKKKCLPPRTTMCFRFHSAMGGTVVFVRNTQHFPQRWAPL